MPNLERSREVEIAPQKKAQRSLLYNCLKDRWYASTSLSDPETQSHKSAGSRCQDKPDNFLCPTTSTEVAQKNYQRSVLGLEPHWLSLRWGGPVSMCDAEACLKYVPRRGIRKTVNVFHIIYRYA